MSAAILQGVPGSTLDTDFWIDLPPRQSQSLRKYSPVGRVCPSAPRLPMGYDRRAETDAPYLAGSRRSCLNFRNDGYIRVLNICHKQGATIRANTVADLTDGTIVNFIYEIHGLKKFSEEIKRARRLRWLGTQVHVLSLKQIYQSKKFVGWPKDIAQLPLLEQTMRLQRHLAQKRTRD